ncbi:hypothetical protein E1N52_34000 [Paraburkholderia guartelaensis]|uniref:DSBA-like thioredoxin domain-containing protein n=1 Tax=Paraburkholderia guartelaensis TaxID=2546446 RepID=A0A4R5L5H2_9BURK|nr:hypothetical protein [Paraburkholderia guartelaensis]TDG03512.1 hypothetical protein E1N52_34000 [Paraburkholderia guartelaensis]
MDTMLALEHLGFKVPLPGAYGFTRDEALAIAGNPDWRVWVERQAASSTAAGVRSVPHFIFGERIQIAGCRSESEIASAISEAICGIGNREQA